MKKLALFNLNNSLKDIFSFSSNTEHLIFNKPVIDNLESFTEKLNSTNSALFIHFLAKKNKKKNSSKTGVITIGRTINNEIQFIVKYDVLLEDCSFPVEIGNRPIIIFKEDFFNDNQNLEVKKETSIGNYSSSLWLELIQNYSNKISIENIKYCLVFSDKGIKLCRIKDMKSCLLVNFLNKTENRFFDHQIEISGRNTKIKKDELNNKIGKVYLKKQNYNQIKNSKKLKKIL